MTTDVRQEPWCRDCGMPLQSWREYHPFEACAAYKRTHDSRYVREMLKARPTAGPKVDE